MLPGSGGHLPFNGISDFSAELSQAALDGPVPYSAADDEHESAEDGGIDAGLQFDGAIHGLAELLGESVEFLLFEFDDCYDGAFDSSEALVFEFDGLAADFRDQGQASSGCEHAEQVHGEGAEAVAEQTVDQLVLAGA